ncbi:MAG: hypothetical protein AAFV53_29980 [Myxococcota bacterium]
MSVALPAFSMFVATGDAPIRPLDAAVGWDGGAAVLTMTVSSEDYDRIDAAAMLHLDPIMRRGGEARLDRSQPVRITARLHENDARDLLTVAPDDDALAAALQVDVETHPFRRQDAWYATTVTQERMPGVRVGYRTEWDG